MYKQLTEFFTIKNDFFIYVLVIVGMYTGQTFFKLSKCHDKGTFSWKKLLNGLYSYSLYFMGVIVVFFAGQLIPDLKLIPLGKDTLTVEQALTLLAYYLMALQSIKCFKNIKETFNIKDEDIVVNDHSATLRG